MRDFLSVQQKLLPDLLEVLQKRYSILRYIMLMQPVGRRSLAGMLHTTERILRAEVDFLRQQDLIRMESVGMTVTAAGVQLLEQMEPMVKELFGYTEMEKQLSRKLGIPEVYIVPGDADKNELAKKELGRLGARLLRQYVKTNDVVAVTGGSTMAEVAEMLPSSPMFDNVQFVPARGGLGETVEYQANTLASLMAKKTGGQYRLLHVPDNLSKEAYQSLIQDPAIAEILRLIWSARVVIHGIGEAITMARRRNIEETVIAQLRESHAVGEAFGYYFNSHGEIVYRMQTIGIHLEHVKEAELVIAVAGGQSKAEAIAAVTKQQYQNVLVTDEAAARFMLNKDKETH